LRVVRPHWPTIIIDQPFIDYQRASRGNGFISLPKQHYLGSQIPVMKNPAHYQNVCFRKGIRQEVAWAKFQAMLQSMLADVLVEHRLDLKLCRDVFKQGVAVGLRYGFDGLHQEVEPR
jgi:hypothetical protein